MTVISIHAPREGSDGDGGGGRHPQLHISIHAPREGSDGPDHRRVIHLCAISIHAPREGSDTRRARHTPGWTHFYPRSP